MKFLNSIVALGFVLTATAALAQGEDPVCKIPNRTNPYVNSHKNEAQVHGVTLHHLTKLGDAYFDSEQVSSLDPKTGAVSHKNAGPFFLMSPSATKDSGKFKFWARNDSAPYTEPDKMRAEMILLESVSDKDAQESGINCPENGYAKWDQTQSGFISKNALYCERTWDNATQTFKYNVMHIVAVCKNSVVFNWEYEPSGSPIFSPDTQVRISSSAAALQR